jgi:hypothetical protein
VQDSNVRSRLKAQLTKFSAQLCEGLSKPLSRFVSQMLFGIQSSQEISPCQYLSVNWLPIPEAGFRIAVT